MIGWTKIQMAAEVAALIPPGSFVNLGIGLPELVAECIPPSSDVTFQSENGLLGMGPTPHEGAVDHDLINAGKKAVTILPGGTYFHHADSFAMIRGGHIDVCVMGAFEVATGGDLANWSSGAPGRPPAVGGAMDLAAGAKMIITMMTHRQRSGAAKLVRTLSMPATAIGVVRYVVTDLCVVAICPDHGEVRKIAPNVTFGHISAVSDMMLVDRSEGIPANAPTPART